MSHDHAAMKALPDDLLSYMRSHIKAKRDDLDGFLAIGNEVNRAATYDRWLAALAAPAAPVAQPVSEPAALRAPLTRDQKRAMWVMATIGIQSHENCYVRGVEDAERVHGIGQEGGAA